MRKKVSIKSMPLLCLNPLVINLAFFLFGCLLILGFNLNIYFDTMERFFSDNSSNIQVLLLKIEYIHSSINFF